MTVKFSRSIHAALSFALVIFATTFSLRASELPPLSAACAEHTELYDPGAAAKK